MTFKPESKREALRQMGRRYVLKEFERGSFVDEWESVAREYLEETKPVRTHPAVIVGALAAMITATLTIVRFVTGQL